MASKIGIFPLQTLCLQQPSDQHNPQSSAPGLPVKAAEIIFGGCMVAYDPANSQAQSADPSMPATARVVGFCRETVDNRLGAKGALTVSPFSDIGWLKSDGNLTAAHIYSTVRVVDDHTVGLLAGTNADRPAGILIGLDGDRACVVVSPQTARRGPTSITLASANGAMAAAADLAAVKVEGEKLSDDFRALVAALTAEGIIAQPA